MNPARRKIQEVSSSDRSHEFFSGGKRWEVRHGMLLRMEELPGAWIERRRQEARGIQFPVFRSGDQIHPATPPAGIQMRLSETAGWRENEALFQAVPVYGWADEPIVLQKLRDFEELP